MEQTRKPVRQPNERRLTVAFALGAILAGAGLLASSPAAAQTTITDAADFQSALTGAANGETITIDSTVTEIDLSAYTDKITKITASGVTLQGAASFDFGAAVKTQAERLLVDSGAVQLRSSLDSALQGLTSTLMADLPSTTLFNSAAASGAHAGISASQGGLNLINLTFMGTTANVTNTVTDTGASKYMGLVGSTFDRYTDAASQSENGFTHDGNGMGALTNVAFVNNVTTATGDVDLVGNTIFFTQRRYNADGSYTKATALNPDRIETMEGIYGSIFIGNQSLSDMDYSATNTIGNRDLGAGVGWVYLKELENSYFADNYTQGHHAFGGGLFTYALGTVSDTVFYNNIVASDHDAYGGAIYSSGIDSISGSVFIGNEAQGLLYSLGRESGALGGAINATGTTVSADGTVVMDDPVSLLGIGSIEDSLFAYNRAYNETGEEALGGAINVARTFSSLSGSVFYGNSVVSNGRAFGGAIAINVNDAAMDDAVGGYTTITDSSFLNNSVISEGDGGGAAISINATSADVADYSLNLVASAGGLTEFSGNTVTNDSTASEANSIYVGREKSSEDNQTNVTINVIAQTGGTVALLDPLKVGLNNSKTFTLINHGASGHLIWDGINDLSAEGGNYVILETGSNTTFNQGYHLHSTAGDSIDIDLESEANLNMVLTGRNKNMALFEDAAITGDAGATLSVAYQGFADYSGSWLLSDAATAQGADLKTSEVLDADTGASTAVDLSTSGGQTWVNLTYSGPTKSFAAAGANATEGRYALQEAWENMLSGNYFSGEAEQTAYYNRVLNDLNNYTAEAYASQGAVALSTTYGLASQVIASNQRSWSSARGASQPAFGDSEGQVRIWADFVGSRIDQDTRSRRSGYEVDTKGAAFGLSYDSGQVWSIGGYLSVADGETDYDDLRAEMDTDIFQGGLFASYRAATNGFGATLDVSYAKLENDSTRWLIGDRYEADFDQTVFGVGLDLSYEFNPWENGRLTPFLNMRYQSLDQDSVRESSPTGLLPLNVKSADGDSFTTVLGLSLEHSFYFQESVFTPRLSAGWRHEFGDRDISTRYDIAGASLVTRADSVEKAANAFDLGASFTLVPWACNDVDFGINAGYSASLSSDRVEHNFYGGLEVKF